LKADNRRCARSIDTRSASLRWGTYGWSNECVNVHHRPLPMAGLFCQSALLAHRRFIGQWPVDALPRPINRRCAR